MTGAAAQFWPGLGDTARFPMRMLFEERALELRVRLQDVAGSVVAYYQRHSLASTRFGTVLLQRLDRPWLHIEVERVAAASTYRFIAPTGQTVGAMRSVGMPGATVLPHDLLIGETPLLRLRPGGGSGLPAVPQRLAWLGWFASLMDAAIDTVDVVRPGQAPSLSASGQRGELVIEQADAMLPEERAIGLVALMMHAATLRRDWQNRTSG